MSSGELTNMSDEDVADELGLDVEDVANSRAEVLADIIDAEDGLREYQASLPEPTDEELQAEADDYERRQLVGGLASGRNRKKGRGAR
jgi:hypothetical protein